jgi:FAD/FMN-containing dehydrogenase/Fe-S oxidoreductase
MIATRPLRALGAFVNAPSAPLRFHAPSSGSALERRLRAEVDGEVLFDRFTRGRYSTDASIYQIEPLGVVVPRTEDAARCALEIAADAGVAILPRGAGTSQCGQTVGAALVIDHSKHLNGVLAIDPEQCVAEVQPGVVLDRLNAKLRPHGLWYPVDVSTSAQATLGGMAGNNSCGARSIRYGNMVHNVLGIEAWLPSGETFWFGPDEEVATGPAGYRALVEKIQAIARREAAEIEMRWPKVLRRVQGYNLDMVMPDQTTGANQARRPHNLAHLLIGSEGTLAYFQRLRLKLAPIPRHKVLGVCHFPSFYRAMDATQHIVRLEPDAVELADRTMIELARGIPQFRDAVSRFIRGEPDAVLLVEFAGNDRGAQLTRLKRLAELMGELGLPGSVVEAAEPALQREIWEVRKAGLNIMMSMKGEGKPVSFIEDCAVPLEHLAEYTQCIDEIFRKHGTCGTWYAHASVGTLHVRPVLNMKEDGTQKMRAIAEEACALVRRFKGAYSGEHGDGLVRSEWIEPILGARLTRALEEIKAAFDPRGLMNPGKIVRPGRMDDRSLFRYKPGYAVRPLDTALDWKQWDGLGAAVEMCNNNGHCRKFDAGTMCPSYRVTLDEQHLTRGRANTLRLALSGQLGPEALTCDALHATLDLCVSCKGCKRECPTGVDMARMKVEFLHHYHRRHGYRLKHKLIAHLPRYAPWASRIAPLLNLRDRVPLLARLSEAWLGLSARRRLPRWRLDWLRDTSSPAGTGGRDVVLFVDTFTRYFEPDNARAAQRVLEAGGYRVQVARATDGGRPLCCGRTFLAVGMVQEARREAQRMLAALGPHVERGVPIVGLEPSCLFTLRDEYLALGLDERLAGVLSERALLFEEFLAGELEASRLALRLKPISDRRALVHGHCHQKAFAAMPAVQRALELVPELEVDLIESSCCGMAGAFGYEAEHFDVSMKMAEASLLPKVRAAPPSTVIVADGVSCRHQIRDGTGRRAVHVARVLERALS